VMLSAFGTFWTSEGFGFTWPGSDAVLALLVAGYAVVAGVALMLAKRARTSASGASG